MRYIIVRSSEGEPSNRRHTFDAALAPVRRWGLRLSTPSRFVERRLAALPSVQLQWHCTSPPAYSALDVSRAEDRGGRHKALLGQRGRVVAVAAQGPLAGGRGGGCGGTTSGRRWQNVCWKRRQRDRWRTRLNHRTRLMPRGDEGGRAMPGGGGRRTAEGTQARWVVLEAAAQAHTGGTRWG
jgi:hypothetical protein